MSKLKQVTAFSTGNKRQGNQVIEPISLPPSFPSLDQIYEITLVDYNGKPYVFRLLKNKPEPESDALDDTISYESLSIDLNDIKDIFMLLTDDQRNIVMHIYYKYKNIKQIDQENDIDEEYEDNPKIILQGPAGTGKSTIINLIEKLITWEENKSSNSPQKIKVLKCAFTGKAASNIDGVTLNHMFSIPIYKTRSLAKKRLASKKEVLEDCIFFICDEISMVGERLMSSVNLRLQQIFENDKLYGDRFVLLVGDLYQIDPVRQKPVYPKSELWTCCEFYELTKIIRQQDENFINALNNFRDSKMTKEDIDLIKSREIQNIDQVPDSVIHLFYINDKVDEYNDIKLNKSSGKEEKVNAIDDSEDWTPNNLRVKVGIRYMITKNMDVGDGLANGSTGVVKHFDYDENGGVLVIWMDFHSDVIGKKTRLAYLKQTSRPGFEKWVPIQRSTMLVKLKSDTKCTKSFPNMFPLRAAEAITVHKSQGQTYEDGVCIHLTDYPYDKLRTDKSLQYVALTRVRRLEDLYILGTLNVTITNSNKFIRTENELNRLRNERKLKIAYETFEDKPDDVIMFLNTGLTFNEHYQFITTDKWYGNGSLLIFTETNTIGSDEIEIPNFEIVYRSDDKAFVRSGGGIICYKKASKSVEIITSKIDDENKFNLTLMLYEKFLYIVTGVKGNMNNDDLKLAINPWISEYIRDERCILFLGNMDTPPNEEPLADFFNDLNFRKILSSDLTISDNESRCDLVYIRNFDVQQEHIGFYEYIPSSNKPIYVKLPLKSELINYEKPGTSQQYNFLEKMEVE